MKDMVATVAKGLDRAQTGTAARVANTFTVLWYAKLFVTVCDLLHAAHDTRQQPSLACVHISSLPRFSCPTASSCICYSHMWHEASGERAEYVGSASCLCGAAFYDTSACKHACTCSSLLPVAQAIRELFCRERPSCSIDERKAALVSLQVCSPHKLLTSKAAVPDSWAVRPTLFCTSCWLFCVSLSQVCVYPEMQSACLCGDSFLDTTAISLLIRCDQLTSLPHVGLEKRQQLLQIQYSSLLPYYHLQQTSVSSPSGTP